MQSRGLAIVSHSGSHDCCMTNNELFHWLVEMCSCNIHHNWMVNQSHSS